MERVEIDLASSEDFVAIREAILLDTLSCCPSL